MLNVPGTESYLKTLKRLLQIRTLISRPSTPVPVRNQLIPEVVAAVVRATTPTDKHIEVRNKSLKESFKELTENGLLIYSVYAIAILTIREK